MKKSLTISVAFCVGVPLLLLLCLLAVLLCSHAQATGGDQANSLYLELERMGFKCWVRPDW